LTVVAIENADYSPDGIWIVFEGDSRDVWFMTATGTDRVEIPAGEGSAFDPAWRPALSH
jgi:hypothetical protein